MARSKLAFQAADDTGRRGSRPSRIGVVSPDLEAVDGLRRRSSVEPASRWASRARMATANIVGCSELR
jgi:hypothetical protein